jgi:tetratricopeptide (TPR) repeat protein
VDGIEVDDPDQRCEIAGAHAFRALAEDRLEDAAAIWEGLAGMPGPSAGHAYGVRICLACVLAALGRHEAALACARAGVEEMRGLPGLATPLHAICATLLTRLGRLDEARAAVDAARRAAERSGDRALGALADHDAGTVALAAGDHEEAARLIARGLADDAPVNRPLSRLAVAEALARTGRADEAQAELRAATLEPVGPADGPATLVARLTHVQALIAIARGDADLARRRLEEAAAAWRRQPVPAGGGHLAATLVDIGRPTLAPTEPDRELARVERELEDLEAMHARVR